MEPEPRYAKWKREGKQPLEVTEWEARPHYIDPGLEEKVCETAQPPRDKCDKGSGQLCEQLTCPEWYTRFIGRVLDLTRSVAPVTVNGIEIEPQRQRITGFKKVDAPSQLVSIVPLFSVSKLEQGDINGPCIISGATGSADWQYYNIAWEMLCTTSPSKSADLAKIHQGDVVILEFFPAKEFAEVATTEHEVDEPVRVQMKVLRQYTLFSQTYLLLRAWICTK